MPTLALRTLASLRYPVFWGMAASCVFFAFLLLTGLVGGVWAAMVQFKLFEIGWVDTTSDVAASLLSLVLGWFLFPVVVPVILGVFLDKAMDVVEGREYPGVHAARPQPLARSLGESVKFVSVALVANLLLLPFIFIPVVNVVAYYLVNGYLLGREYFTMAAVRHMDYGEARLLRKQIRKPLMVSGMALAALHTLPFINLVAPLLAAVWMVHAFHRLRSA